MDAKRASEPAWDVTEHGDLLKRVDQVIRAEFGSPTAFKKRFTRGTPNAQLAHALGNQLTDRNRGAKGRRARAKPAPQDVNLSTLVRFARLTRRRLEWLVYGTGAEHETEVVPRGLLGDELVTYLRTELDAHIPAGVVPGAAGAAVVPLLEPDASRVLAFVVAAMREELARARAELVRERLWEVASWPPAESPVHAAARAARRVRGGGPAATKHEREVAAADARAGLRRLEQETSMREGTVPLGLFRRAGVRADATTSAPAPLPPFTVRVLPIAPFSEYDARPAAVLSRARKGAPNADRRPGKRGTARSRPASR